MSEADEESDITRPSAGSHKNQPHFEHATAEIVGDRYRIDSVLGQGGMGTVYLATQIFLKEKIALKILNKRQTFNETNRRRFEIEGKASYALNHSNLIKVLDFGILPDQSPYFAMEYVSGMSLQDLLKQQKRLDVKDALQIFDQICDGLAYAHKHHVIHRDIKPSNIMISANAGGLSEDLHVKVVDFGIAKIMTEERGEAQALTQTGEVFGSPLYMSPEQCKGGHIDGRTDIYSLGCTLFEALTGTPPHVGSNSFRTMMLHTSEPAPSLQEASLGISFTPELEAIVKKMLAINREERYQNIEHVKDDLKGIAAHLGKNEVSKSRSPSHLSSNEDPSGVPRKIVVAVSLSIIVLGATIFGAYSFVTGNAHPSQLQTTAITKKQEHFDRNVDADIKDALSTQDLQISKLEHAAPISTKIVTENGTKKLQINFPDVPVGSLSYGQGALNFQSPFVQTENSYDAKGPVTVPLNVPLELSVGGVFQVSFNTPNIFSKIPSDLFSKILIEKPSGYQLSENALLTQVDFAKCLANILQRVQTWNKLNAISLCKLRLTDDSVKALNSIKNLQSLSLWNNFGSEEKLIGTPLLLRLKALHLKSSNSDQLLEAICHSKALEELTLAAVTHTPRTFIALSQCKALQTLHLILRDISDADLHEITKIKSLREIYFDDVALTNKQLADFMAQSPQLKTVYVSNASARTAANYIDASRRIRIKQTLPNFPP